LHAVCSVLPVEAYQPGSAAVQSAALLSPIMLE
jgi:hypothetical protein